MDNKQVTFLAELHTGAFLNILEHLNTAKDGESIAIDLDINEPETAFYWGEFLAHSFIINSFYEEFKINLFELGMEEDKEFAKELLAMSIDLEQRYKNILEDE